MKKFILTVTAFLPALLFAQDQKFTVTGSIGTFNAPAKVYIQYQQNRKPVSDSVILKNGKFEFAGIVGAVPVNAYLIFNEKGTGLNNYHDYKNFYLEPGNITIVTADALKNAKVAGGKTNTENAAYLIALKPVTDGYAAMEAKEKAATPEQQQSVTFKAQAKKEEKALDLKETNINKKFIQEHPDSYVSLNALQSFAYGADYTEIDPLFEGLSPAVKQSAGGVAFAALLPKLKAVALGATAPEFAEADTSGKMISLSSFRGKYVLIDFWASWCGPCRQENPNVVKAFNQYKNKNFTILGVSLDRTTGKEAWLKAIRKDGLAWTQVSDLQFWNSKTAGMYGVRAIPQNFLIDPQGKIIGKNLRGDDLENKLEELFGKI